MKKILLTMFMMVLSMASWAQNYGNGQPRFDPDKFQQMVEQSLAKAACLTPEESKVFFPQYNAMREEQRKMGAQIYELKKNVKNDAKSYSAAILKINQLKVDMAEVEQNFYKRILKSVPAEKVFKLIKAEDDFHRRMVQGQRGGSHRSNNRQGNQWHR